MLSLYKIAIYGYWFSLVIPFYPFCIYKEQFSPIFSQESLWNHLELIASNTMNESQDIPLRALEPEGLLKHLYHVLHTQKSKQIVKFNPSFFLSLSNLILVYTNGLRSFPQKKFYKMVFPKFVPPKIVYPNIDSPKYISLRAQKHKSIRLEFLVN